MRDGPVPVTGPCPACGSEDWRPAGRLPELWLWLYEGGQLRRGLVICGRCGHREQSTGWRFLSTQPPAWRRHLGTPWQLLQVVRVNRSQVPVPLTYLLAGSAGALAALPLRGRGRPWASPAAAVAGTWLWFLTSALRGPRPVEPLREQLLDVLQPAGAEERHLLRQDRLVRGSDLPLYAVGGWTGHRAVQGYGWDGERLASLSLEFTAGAGTPEEPRVTVEVSRPDPLVPLDAEPDAGDLAQTVLPGMSPGEHPQAFLEEWFRHAEEVAARGATVVDIPVDGAATRFRVLTEGDAWTAAGAVDGHRVRVLAVGVPLEGFRLERVPDPTPYLEGSRDLARRAGD